jgi:hypothetical protein
VRWDELFTDLEVHADGLAQRERDAEIAERTRIELASLTLLDRLHAGVGQEVSIDVLGAGRLTGRLRRVGPVWLLLDVDSRQGWAVGLDAVTGVQGLTAAAEPAPDGRSQARGATWASAFRSMSRDREVVLVRRLDGAAVRGLPARVGRDFVEIWERDDDSSADRGPRTASRLTIVPYSAVAAVAVRTGS